MAFDSDRPITLSSPDVTYAQPESGLRDPRQPFNTTAHPNLVMPEHRQIIDPSTAGAEDDQPVMSRRGFIGVLGAVGAVAGTALLAPGLLTAGKPPAHEAEGSLDWRLVRGTAHEFANAVCRMAEPLISDYLQDAVPKVGRDNWVKLFQFDDAREPVSVATTQGYQKLANIHFFSGSEQNDPLVALIYEVHEKGNRTRFHLARAVYRLEDEETVLRARSGQAIWTDFTTLISGKGVVLSRVESGFHLPEEIRANRYWGYADIDLGYDSLSTSRTTVEEHITTDHVLVKGQPGADKQAREVVAVLDADETWLRAQ